MESKADETLVTGGTTSIESKAEGDDKETGNAGTAGNIDNLKDEGTDLPLRGAVKNQDTNLEHPHGTLAPVTAATGHIEEKGDAGAGAETKGLEEDGGLKGAIEERGAEGEDSEEDEDDEEEEPNAASKDVGSISDQSEPLPGKKTQEQGAAVGDEAGVSVGD